MFFKNTYPALLWAVLILLLTLSPQPEIPKVTWIHIPNADKIVHFTLFGVLYVLLMRGLMKQYPPEFYGRAVLWSLVIVVFYGGATEILQAIVPTGRDADIMDWIADCAGTGAACLVYSLFFKRKSISA